MTADHSLRWHDGTIVVIDQRHPPTLHRWLRIATPDDLPEAISTLAIPGVPAIGVPGTLGVARPARC